MPAQQVLCGCGELRDEHAPCAACGETPRPLRDAKPSAAQEALFAAPTSIRGQLPMNTDA